MASRKTVTPDNLAALGAERLAAILVELAEGDAEVKRRLRLELAAQSGGDTIAAEIGKRITTLRSARSFIDWQKRRDFVKDLDLQRAMIVDRVAQSRADLALDLMWRFMDLAEPVLNRVDDSNGSVGDVFRSACADLGAIALKAKPDPVSLADRVFAAVIANGYGVFDRLVRIMLPALGDAGAARLKDRLTRALADRSRKAAERDYQSLVLRSALQALADGQGDVDAYIALVPSEERRMPHAGTEIGRRLLAAGRAAEALAVLEQARPRRSAARAAPDDDLFATGFPADNDWEETYIEAREATGKKVEAQRLRWAAFEQRLSAGQLRAYLKRLPDFEDVEAEERAMQHALGFRSFSAALDFFTSWPDQARAAELVLARSKEMNGNLYHLLEPAARLMEGKHPLAATLLRRAMIEDTLDGAKSTRYKHAARHLLECRSLAAGIPDFAPFEAHEAFVARLRSRHGRKTGFWSQVSEGTGDRG
ncbi:DUF6880 family protein [Paracraurococcus lichenis]|uniref:Uncharacterized protein n=1 Tax=Paracraurococcus lichenis TaxID=3064888 RepID=A0ABT9EBL8_9PROT|nr:DUF6880 family protein [Paracraurococcus sp. LOR1-02]MDO9713601.1 hypothetical protein [Paracraurococcus sp. LOR1-02]